jgi:phosphate transport system substrate-binding protein
MTLNYLSIGSGGGLEQLRARTVDFGASEYPLPEGQLQAQGLLQFPMVVGAVVVGFNLPGLPPGDLKLTPELLGRIYLGEVTFWNDRAIRDLNPGLKLPGLPITVVHRADGSGTTWLFTQYLTRSFPAWGKAVGAGPSVRWPAGAGGKGNEGVAAYIKTIPGAIGYVEATYAAQSGLTMASLRNRDGRFVAPSPEAYKAAEKQADWSGPVGDGTFLLDLPGPDTWPIVGASYILIYNQQPDAAKAKSLLLFLDWCLREGSGVATELGYVPLPDGAVRHNRAAWAAKVRSGNQAVWPPAPAAAGKP